METYTLNSIPNIECVGKISGKCVGCLSSDTLESIVVPADPQPFREYFRYAHCSACGTLSLLDRPDLIGDYYPDDYYSFTTRNATGMRRWAKMIRDRWSAFGAGPFTQIVDRLSLNPSLATLRPLFEGFLGQAFGRQHAYLDVGCGDGQNLWDMKAIGFRNLTGIDPFMRKPSSDRGFRLIRGIAADLSETFDVVILRHSLEHVPNPEKILGVLRNLISESGVMVIGIPLAGSWAWREYGGEWVQLDAPRHSTLFTVDGFAKMAIRNNWEIKKIVYDSDSFQITGSLLRRMGINIHKQPAVLVQHFSFAERRRFARIAGNLNRTGEADSATFFLVPRRAGS